MVLHAQLVAQDRPETSVATYGTNLVYQGLMHPNYNMNKVSSWFFLYLVAGLAGCDSSTPQPHLGPASDGVADPSTMIKQRQRHAAAFYQKIGPNGKNVESSGILIVGGIEGPPGSMEFARLTDANPSSLAWKPSLHPAVYHNFGVDELARRDLRATTMRDGKILISGGTACASMTTGLDCEKLRKPRASLLLFDPQGVPDSGWSKWAWVTKPRGRHTVVHWPLSASAKDCEKENGEMLYLLGGRGKDLRDTKETFTYAPNCLGIMESIKSVDLFTSPVEVTSEDCSAEWEGHTATLISEQDPKILVVGRIEDEKKCEAFLVQSPGDEKDEKWTKLSFSSDVTIPCDGHSAEIIGAEGKQSVAIVGGEVVAGQPLKQVLLFDLAKLQKASTDTNFDVRVKSLMLPRSYAATAVTHTGDLVIAGGFKERIDKKDIGLRKVELFDSRLETSRELLDMQCPRVHHTMTRLHGADKEKSVENFMVVGGSGDNSPPSCPEGPGNSSEILYMNEACVEHTDCSPGNECVGVGNEKRCFPTKKK
jgi:hypothetical protein